MRIKDWNKFQHYKHRGPPWIKLHRSLLNDREWFSLDGDASKMLANCWLLASERDGELPSVEDMAFRLRMDVKEVHKQLSKLNHWLEQDASTALAPCKQSSSTETETETQERDRDRKPGKRVLPDDWVISESHYELGASLGLSKREIEEASEEMRAWSLGNGEKRANWDYVLNNWLRRNAKKGNRNGKTTGNIIQAADRLIERLAEFEQDEIRGGEGENVVRLIPKRGSE